MRKNSEFVLLTGFARAALTETFVLCIFPLPKLSRTTSFFAECHSRSYVMSEEDGFPKWYLAAH